jgi:putative membrane protein
MIKYNPKSWFKLIFHSYSKYVFKNLVPAQIFLAAYSFLVVYIIQDYLELQLASTTAVHSLLGIVLGLFLVFRTNSAYDRWWEGRKMWGNLVNDSRNLTLKLHTHLKLDNLEERDFFSRMISNFAFSLKEHLRRVPEYQDLEFGDINAEERYNEAPHKPNFVLTELFGRVNVLKEKNIIDGFQYLDIQQNLNGMVDSLGACERIRNTPIPYSYSMFMKKFVFLFLITLPFAFLGEFGYWSIALVILVTYILLGTELIAEEIEDPFGRDVNDLPTDLISDKIKNDVIAILHNEVPKLSELDESS